MSAIIDKVMPASVTKISNLAKRFWQKDESSESNRPLEVSPQTFSRGESFGFRVFSLYLNQGIFNFCMILLFVVYQVCYVSESEDIAFLDTD